MENLLEAIAYCVERGKVNERSPFPPDLKGKEGTDELTQKALEFGIKPGEILNSGLMIGMERIGKKFRENKVFVPDVLMSAKSMNSGMRHLKPFFQSGEVKHRGIIVIGTVMGDLHDIGKNIVGMILGGGGWNVIDLGVDVSPEKFISAIEKNNAQAVGLSALLTTTMLNMDIIIKEIKLKYPDIKIIVGGAPLSHDYANKINADFYSPDPQGALDYLNKLFSNI